MKKYILLTISLLMAGTAIAQTEPDAIYNLIRRSYTANPDGSMDINYRKEIKLIRNRAITAYADKGETFITYNPQFESLKINECYTIMADGTKVQTPENAFIEQLPSECTDCGRFNGIRELAIVHTALEYNCVIILDYTIHRNSSIYTESFNYQQDCPVMSYEVRFPDGHTQVMSALTESINEPYMPTRRDYDVEIRMGTMPTYTAERSLPAAHTLLSNLRQADQKDYAAAIRNWVVDNVHLNTVDLSHVNYSMAPAAEVFNTNCGTLLDKTGLLAALLNEAGFRATLVDANNGQPEVELSLDGNIYHLCANSKGALLTDGQRADKSAVASAPIYIDRELQWQSQPISEGYVSFTLPTEDGALNINPAYLTPTRFSPVQARLTNEFYHYTVTLPKGAKLIGGDYTREITHPNLGSINIIVKQKGNRLLITRSLQLRKAVIEKADYEMFRQLMNEWYSHRQFTFEL